ncbi:MAG: hypothetical protein E7463_01065 [Ruminococcaceae bacterium]|nr:hypothetical protein [Oscillospiraceae bacterium]
MTKFPRTTVGGMSLPRMLIGSNWILGYSHRTSSADQMIRDRHADPAQIEAILEAYLDYGIDAMMAPFKEDTPLMTAIRNVQERRGQKIIMIDTPIIRDMSNTREAYAIAEAQIKESARLGSDFCLLHHGSAEKLVSKLDGTMNRLPDYLYMMREAGMRTGLSAHMPELVLYSDANDYDVDTYIQIYNCMGFLMQVEVESVHRIIHNAKKPVMTIKSMAAGRVTPFVGITFNYATIRDCDMVTVGAYAPNEVHEDVEIALAAIERRAPVLGQRSSPNKTAVLGGAIR